MAISDLIKWWYDRRDTFPHLSRMSRDYLTIPATCVGAERVFSRGRLVLSHIRNRLSAESTRALMCVGAWSLLDIGLINPDGIKAVAKLPDMEKDEEERLADGWDTINLE
ncbi:hypothetical protein ONZ45_g8364 [Pleurotus djamor]|nr:hypothetical protein ONZ45_g8364 [Pleurotus djamor]